jgi:hypothetical protein
MNTIQRFILDHQHGIVDVLNPTWRNGDCYMQPETQTHLRERVLLVQLGHLVDDLANLQPEMTDARGQTYRPFDHGCHSIWMALYSMIQATHINALDPAFSVQNRFDGKLTRSKKGLQAFTSLSLFRNDVERLLRDLYGDVKGEALDPIMYSVFIIVQELTKHVRTDLWREHEDAASWDYIWGIGVPEGYGISSGQNQRGLDAAENLRLRACSVNEDPSSFSKYTVEFATEHIGRFIKLESSSDGELPF